MKAGNSIIVLDTETTGLLNSEDKLIEIGGVEIKSNKLTGRTFHTYINPEGRAVHPAAFAVHGLSNEFLRGQPIFADVIDDFLAFIGTSTLVIHNAPFDLGFLNRSLKIHNHDPIDTMRVIDSLELARRMYPGSPVSLDALCRRFGISLEKREKHGALVDADLLARVYILMAGATQETIALEVDSIQEIAPRTKRIFTLTAEEREAHLMLLEKIDCPNWSVVFKQLQA